VKVFDLLDRVGWEHAERVLPALLYRLGVFTREELIPTERRLRERLEQIEPRLEELYALSSGDDLSGEERSGLIGAVLDGTDAEALDAVVRALEKGAHRRSIAQALCVAAAERLVRFDERIGTDPAVQDGWLDIVHLFTYANAARHAVERYECPDVLRLLLFGARFIQRGRGLDLDREARGLSDLVGLSAATLEDALAAVRARDARRAIALASDYLASGGDRDALRDALEGLVLSDHGVRPIYVAHQVKLLYAAWDESLALGESEDAIRPLLAAVHYLASPLDQRGLETIDKEESVRFYERIFGFKYEGPFGHFAPIKIPSQSLTLDFDNREKFDRQHYAFKVSETEFDAIFERVRDEGLEWGSGPFSPSDGEINHWNGGRGVYFCDPNGHLLELLTRDYTLEGLEEQRRAGNP
jgi:catechol 2,3-dioxygenase-like lactoylglutathione lyase family enzyme